MTAEEIAKGLSEAQRRVILGMTRNISWGPDWLSAMQAWPQLIEGVQIRAQCVSYRLTPLGLAVRDRLGGGL